MVEGTLAQIYFAEGMWFLMSCHCHEHDCLAMHEAGVAMRQSID